jgi:predicted CopG family antitoxin
MVNIELSDYVKAELDGIKESEGHKSLDSVVRVLLERRKKVDYDLRGKLK